MPEACSPGWAAVNKRNPLSSDKRHDLKVETELCSSTVVDHATTHSSTSRKRSIEIIEISDSSSEGTPSPPRKLQKRASLSELSISKPEMTSPIHSPGTPSNKMITDRDSSSPPTSPCMGLPARRVQPRRCAKLPRSIESPNQRVTRSTARKDHICSSDSTGEDDVLPSTPLTSPCDTDYDPEEEDDNTVDTNIGTVLTSSPPVPKTNFSDGQAIRESSSNTDIDEVRLADAGATAKKSKEQEHYTDFIIALEAAQKAGEGIECYLELFEGFKAHLVKSAHSEEQSMAVAEAPSLKGQEDPHASSIDGTVETAAMQGSDGVVADAKSSKPGDTAIQNRRPQHSPITEEKVAIIRISQSEDFQRRISGERCSQEKFDGARPTSFQYQKCICLNLPWEMRRCQYIEQFFQEPVSDLCANKNLLSHLRQILKCPAHSPKLKRKCRNLLRRLSKPAHLQVIDEVEQISLRDQSHRADYDDNCRPSIGEAAPIVGSSRNQSHQSDIPNKPRTDTPAPLASVFGRHQSTIPPPEFYPQRGQHHCSRVQANGSPSSKRKGKQKASDVMLQSSKRISSQPAASPTPALNVHQLPIPQISQSNPKTPATKPVGSPQPRTALRDDRPSSNPPNLSPPKRVLQEIPSFNAQRIRHRSLPATTTPTLHPPPGNALDTTITTSKETTPQTSIIQQTIEAALHQKCTEPVENLKNMVREMASQIASLTALPRPSSPINTLTLDDYPVQGGSHTFREALEIWRGPGNARMKRQRAPDVFCVSGRFRREYRPACRFFREGEWEMY